MFTLKEYLAPLRSTAVWALGLAVALLITVTLLGGWSVPDGARGSSGRTDAILFSDLDWSSAGIQARVMSYIVNKGLGYETELVDGDTNLLWFALVHGDADVTMEVWLPNQLLQWRDQLERGTVLDAGDSIGDNWQGWVIPQYVKDDFPGLVSVFDIPTYHHVFAGPETLGKARFVGCANGWSCELVNKTKFRSYGVGEYLHVVTPNGQQSLFEDLGRHYQAREPWLGFMWSPTEPAHQLDLYRLEEPPYSDECWTTHQACAYPRNDIRIGVNQRLVERAPDVWALLHGWDFPSDAQVATEIWLAENGQERLDDAALWYLAAYQETWRPLLTLEQADRVLVSAVDDALRRGVDLNQRFEFP